VEAYKDAQVCREGKDLKRQASKQYILPYVRELADPADRAGQRRPRRLDTQAYDVEADVYVRETLSRDFEDSVSGRGENGPNQAADQEVVASSDENGS